MNFRDQIYDETLSLRKNRHRQDFFARRSFLINDRSRHLICPFKLKGIPEQILEKFRIDDNDLDNTIQKTIEYLSSKELDDIKFGSFLLRIYFNKIVSIEDEYNKKNSTLDYHVDKFIDKGIIGVIGKVLITESNIDILSEITWALINMTYFDTIKNKYGYIKEFINPTYTEIYYKLIKIGDNEITEHLYSFLVNCIIQCEEFAKNIFADENFIRLCIIKYLEPATSIKLEQNSKKATISFFVSLSKLSNIFTEKQKNAFYKLYEKLIGVMQNDPNVLTEAIIGLKYLFFSDKSKEKTVYNIIIKNNYNIFDKMFLSINEILQNGIEFEDIDRTLYLISEIVNQFIILSEEKDVIILLQNTQLLNFIEAFYAKIYYKSVKNDLLNILVKISHHSSNVVNNMVKGHENLLQNVIKEVLKENGFDLKMKGIEIVYYMLSLNSLDINAQLYKTGIIDQLISDNLINDEDQGCLKYILNGILFFINTIKSLESQWKIEIINNFIKIGITNGFENNTTRFNDEHNIIINQIKTDINNILNGNDIAYENKNVNNHNNIISNPINQKMTKNNPFINNENKINFGNIISFESNSKNIQNESNSLGTIK